VHDVRNDYAPVNGCQEHDGAPRNPVRIASDAYDAQARRRREVLHFCQVSRHIRLTDACPRTAEGRANSAPASIAKVGYDTLTQRGEDVIAREVLRWLCIGCGEELDEDPTVLGSFRKLSRVDSNFYYVP
jgi:hypothetical protein